jgi:hypothetical protein
MLSPLAAAVMSFWTKTGMLSCSSISSWRGAEIGFDVADVQISVRQRQPNSSKSLAAMRREKWWELF